MIPLPPTLVKTLSDYQGSAADQELVFNDGNRFWKQRNLIRRYKSILLKAGLPISIRLYDLRHTCATMLLTSGIHPKVVSERLGHATVAITLDIYSHVLPTSPGRGLERSR